MQSVGGFFIDKAEITRFARGKGCGGDIFRPLHASLDLRAGDAHFLQPLQIANRKHDVVALQVYDLRARELPDVGLMRVVDAETGYEQYIDTSSKRLRQAHQKYWNNCQQQLRETMNKSNVDLVSIATNEDYVKYLQQMFARR